MTIFLILILIILILFAPVYAKVTGNVTDENGTVIDQITIVTRMKFYQAIYSKITAPIKVKITLPF